MSFFRCLTTRRKHSIIQKNFVELCRTEERRDMEKVQIVPVQTRKERKEFVEYPLRLYKGNPYFVPPLYGDEMSIFTPKKHLFQHVRLCVFPCQARNKNGGTDTGYYSKTIQRTARTDANPFHPLRLRRRCRNGKGVV